MVGEYVVNQAKLNLTANGSVDTGTLRNSITYRLNGDDELEVVVPVYYGVFVELGTGLFARDGNGRQTPWVYMGSDGKFYTTHGQQPKPFLQPAVDNNLPVIEKYLNDYVLKELMK